MRRVGISGVGATVSIGGLAVGSLTLLGALLCPLLAGCADDAAGVGGAGGGATASSSVSTSGGATSASSAGGQAEGGGGGGTLYCWEGCTEALPLCEDGFCVAACSADRDACDEADRLSCCEPGTVCCDGPAGSGCATTCEVTCPDEATVCLFGTLCELRPADETWFCTPADDCQPERRCGEGCCPLGSRCEGDTCLLPNLRIDEEILTSSIEVGEQTFSENACELPEGCIEATGRRRLLRFDLQTPNVGEGDLFLGKPCIDPDDPDPACADADLFQFQTCHGHPHFSSYAGYRLLDAKGEVAASGHKQAFCLLDFIREGGPPNAVYHCGFQGIQAGWADLYGSELPCQWVDISDVPPGDYRLEVTVNTERLLVESDYDDNVVLADVRIDAEACPGGCSAYDEVACQPGDPEGRAGDGTCDCFGLQEWDALDCTSCQACAVTTCPGGCQVDDLACCGAVDTCGLAADGVCNCAGAAAWDAADCELCLSADGDCPVVDSCPAGCGPTEAECAGEVVPAWQGDGSCDCGAPAWEALDCFSCAAGCQG